MILLTAFFTVIMPAHIAFCDDTPTPSGWEQATSQDFIVYYRPDIPDDFVQTTLNSAEEEFQRITDNMGIANNGTWGIGEPVKIYIYSDRKDYVANAHQALWSHGVAFAQAKVIKLYPEVNGFFDTILPHELGHIVFRSYIGYTVSVPPWFEEGVAIYQEKARRLGSNEIVKEAIEKGQFIPLSRLSGMRLYKDSSDQVVDLFYSESASAVYYMITELGDQEFNMLLNEFRNETPFQEALHKVYLRFNGTSDLNQAWVDYLQGQ